MAQTTSSNSFNAFLLDLCASLIKSLKNNPDALDQLLANKLFMNNKITRDQKSFSKEENTLLSLTQELLQDLSILDDYFDMQMKSEEEYSEEKRDTIAEYIDQIMPLVLAYTMIDEKKQNPDFEAEYAETYQRVMKKIVPIDTAEENLRCWEEILAESYLQKALIRIKFSYIDQKLS